MFSQGSYCLTKVVLYSIQCQVNYYTEQVFTEIVILQFGNLEGNREVNGEVGAERTEDQPYKARVRLQASPGLHQGYPGGRPHGGGHWQGGLVPLQHQSGLRLQGEAEDPAEAR